MSELITKKIAYARTQDLFMPISKELGFEKYELVECIYFMSNLIALWNSQKFIEVYKSDHERQYGRAKSTKKNNSPMYKGLYHARIMTKLCDPLMIITFDKDENDNEFANLRFLVYHDDIFGEKGEEKKDKYRMSAIHKKISDLIKKGSEK